MSWITNQHCSSGVELHQFWYSIKLVPDLKWDFKGSEISTVSCKIKHPLCILVISPRNPSVNLPQSGASAARASRRQGDGTVVHPVPGVYSSAAEKTSGRRRRGVTVEGIPDLRFLSRPRRRRRGGSRSPARWRLPGLIFKVCSQGASPQEALSSCAGVAPQMPQLIAKQLRRKGKEERKTTSNSCGPKTHAGSYFAGISGSFAPTRSRLRRT